MQGSPEIVSQLENANSEYRKCLQSFVNQQSCGDIVMEAKDYLALKKNI